MRALSDSSEEVPHGPRRQAYRPNRRPLGTHRPALHSRASFLPTVLATPRARRAICLRKREAIPSADAEGACDGERLRRRRRREDDRGLHALRGAHGGKGDVRPRRRRAVDHDEPRPASHLLRRQLQEDSDEVGDRHAESAGETFGGLHLPVGHAHVKLLRVPFHLPARLLEPRNRGRADARGARGIPRMERSRAAGGLCSRRPGPGRSVPKEGTRPGPPPRASGPAPGGAAKGYSGDCVHGIGLLLCSGSVRISRPAQRVEGFESFPENAIGLQRRYERGVQVGSPID